MFNPFKKIEEWKVLDLNLDLGQLETIYIEDLNRIVNMLWIETWDEDYILDMAERLEELWLIPDKEYGKVRKLDIDNETRKKILVKYLKQDINKKAKVLIQSELNKKIFNKYITEYVKAWKELSKDKILFKKPWIIAKLVKLFIYCSVGSRGATTAVHKKIKKRLKISDEASKKANIEKIMEEEEKKMEEEINELLNDDNIWNTVKKVVNAYNNWHFFNKEKAKVFDNDKLLSLSESIKTHNLQTDLLETTWSNTDFTKEDFFNYKVGDFENTKKWFLYPIHKLETERDYKILRKIPTSVYNENIHDHNYQPAWFWYLDEWSLSTGREWNCKIVWKILRQLLQMDKKMKKLYDNFFAKINSLIWTIKKFWICHYTLIEMIKVSDISDKEKKKILSELKQFDLLVKYFRNTKEDKLKEFLTILKNDPQLVKIIFSGFDETKYKKIVNSIKINRQEIKDMKNMAVSSLEELKTIIQDEDFRFMPFENEDFLSYYTEFKKLILAHWKKISWHLNSKILTLTIWNGYFDRLSPSKHIKSSPNFFVVLSLMDVIKWIDTLFIKTNKTETYFNNVYNFVDALLDENLKWKLVTDKIKIVKNWDDIEVIEHKINTLSEIKEYLNNIQKTKKQLEKNEDIDENLDLMDIPMVNPFDLEFRLRWLIRQFFLYADTDNWMKETDYLVPQSFYSHVANLIWRTPDEFMHYTLSRVLVNDDAEVDTEKVYDNKQVAYVDTEREVNNHDQWITKLHYGYDKKVKKYINTKYISEEEKEGVNDFDYAYAPQLRNWFLKYVASPSAMNWQIKYRECENKTVDVNQGRWGFAPVSPELYHDNDVDFNNPNRYKIKYLDNGIQFTLKFLRKIWEKQAKYIYITNIWDVTYYTWNTVLENGEKVFKYAYNPSMSSIPKVFFAKYNVRMSEEENKRHLYNPLTTIIPKIWKVYYGDVKTWFYWTDKLPDIADPKIHKALQKDAVFPENYNIDDERIKEEVYKYAPDGMKWKRFAWLAKSEFDKRRNDKKTAKWRISLIAWYIKHTGRIPGTNVKVYGTKHPNICRTRLVWAPIFYPLFPELEKQIWLWAYFFDFSTGKPVKDDTNLFKRLKDAGVLGNTLVTLNEYDYLVGKNKENNFYKKSDTLEEIKCLNGEWADTFRKAVNLNENVLNDINKASELFYNNANADDYILLSKDLESLFFWKYFPDVMAKVFYNISWYDPISWLHDKVDPEKDMAQIEPLYKSVKDIRKEIYDNIKEEYLDWLKEITSSEFVPDIRRIWELNNPFIYNKEVIDNPKWWKQLQNWMFHMNYLIMDHTYGDIDKLWNICLWSTTKRNKIVKVRRRNVRRNKIWRNNLDDLYREMKKTWKSPNDINLWNISILGK